MSNTPLSTLTGPKARPANPPSPLSWRAVGKMTITEDEARKKWCPYARILHPGDEDTGAAIGYNRRTDSGWDDCGDNFCIASECMAWRWKLNDHGHSMNLGWCGLAGSP